MLLSQKVEKLETLQKIISNIVAESKENYEVLKLEDCNDDVASSYIEEVAEELEVTTKFSGTVGMH